RSVFTRPDSQYGYDGVRGILYGDASQLWMQLIDAAVVATFGFLMAYVWFKLSDKITPIRVSRETELEGLDVPEMGALGYPDFTLATGHGLYPSVPGTSAPASPARKKELVTAGSYPAVVSRRAP